MATSMFETSLSPSSSHEDEDDDQTCTSFSNVDEETIKLIGVLKRVPSVTPSHEMGQRAKANEAPAAIAAVKRLLTIAAPRMRR